MTERVEVVVQVLLRNGRVVPKGTQGTVTKRWTERRQTYIQVKFDGWKEMVVEPRAIKTLETK